MRIAIVGAGISGLVSAFVLQRRHDVTLFEAEDRLGGHSHTVRVDLADETHHVDTGFIVYNERNYPNFTKLLGLLGVESQPSDMSFSVSSRSEGFAFNLSSINGAFARRRSVADPGHLRLLTDIARFNRSARRLLAAPDTGMTLQDFVDRGKYGDRLLPHYVIPIGASIWSADPTRFTDFPALAFARFFENHGLLGIRNRPQWRTVVGGSQQYVRALATRLGDRVRKGAAVEKVVRAGGGVELVARHGEPLQFDAVVLACHSGQALRLLSDPTDAETELLGALGYQPNVATLHTDANMLPPLKHAWASWNYHVDPGRQRRAQLTYHMNRLQSLRSTSELCLTLNAEALVDPSKVVGSFVYEHPVFDAAAMSAQQRRMEIQGVNGTYYAGAYWGYGFHEDGVRSALDVCAAFGESL